MKQVMLLVVAIFFANMLTAAFLVGMVRGLKIYDDRDADRGTLLCLLIPLALVGLCLASVLA